jgi:hypothetical protein
VIENRPRATDLPDGHPIIPRSQRGCPQCPMPPDYPDHINGAAANFNYGSSSDRPMQGRTGSIGDNGHAIPTYGFKIPKLAYDTTYCFRLKARRDSDAMVSEVWSNWACATTGSDPANAPLPPLPSRPPDVTADYTPGGVDWRVKPPTVTIKWGYSTNVDSYQVSRAEPWKGQGNIEQQSEHEALDTLVERDIAANTANPSIIYQVCAVNAAGKACTTHTTYVPVGDAVERSSIPKGDMTIPSQPAQDTNRPVPTTQQDPEGQVGRRGGFGTGMSTSDPH